MKMNPEELNFTAWPEEPKTGMITGKIARGVKATHKPTGLFATCDEFRYQHRNREAAIEKLSVIYLSERELK